MFALCCQFVRGTSLSERAANIDEIVCNHAEPDPALHAFVTFVPAAIEAMSALADADASLASGSPSLTVADPSSARVCAQRF